MLFFILSAVLGALIFYFFFWSLWSNGYWQRNGIPFIPSKPLVGNVLDLVLYRCCFGEQFQRLYNHPAACDVPFVGIHVFHNRGILLRDPALIKSVLNTNFSKFSSRFETTDSKGDPMGSLNLFFSKYEVWKDIHHLFTPFFASSRVRQMFPLLMQIGRNLEKHIAALPFDPVTNSTITDVEVMCELFTTDLIASLAFGLLANSLENPSAEFHQMCIEVNDPRLKRILHLFTIFFIPKMTRVFRTRLFTPEYENFMRTSIKFAMEERERSGITRNDLIDIFINLKRTEGKNADSVVNKSDFFEAQAGFLLLAGFDTSSTTIMFGLYELAKQPVLQERLRKELQNSLQQHDGVLSYESVNEMSYLRMVVDETLRLYPATSFLDRVCTAEEGFSLGSFNMPKGMPIYIPVLGLHRDPKLWPDPLQFDPERFTPENRKKHVPLSYLPFGSGPRGCNGTILGLLQVKTGLIHVLKNYRVEMCSKSPPEIELNPKSFVLSTKNGNHLRLVKDTLMAD